jgi:Uncharacterized conserved protein
MDTAGENADGVPDAVVVLGASVLTPGVPSQALRRRIEHGVQVFFERGARHLVVSGGVVTAPPAEAVLMRAIALDHGVPEERIIVEDMARNTFENALYAGLIIRREGWRRSIVVTDAFHLPRALYCFRRLGLAVEGEGVPRRPNTTRLTWVRNYAEEMVRFARSAGLFMIGSHKPLLERVWGR